MYKYGPFLVYHSFTPKHGWSKDVKTARKHEYLWHL